MYTALLSTVKIVNQAFDYHMAGNLCGVLIFVVDLAVTKFPPIKMNASIVNTSVDPTKMRGMAKYIVEVQVKITGVIQLMAFLILINSLVAHTFAREIHCRSGSEQ